MSAPDALHFTDDEEANRLLARDPFALLIGMALDQQVTVQTAFAGPQKLLRRLGTLEPKEIAGTDPQQLEAAFREKPAVHRFPGSMATRVHESAVQFIDPVHSVSTSRIMYLWCIRSGTPGIAAVGNGNDSISSGSVAGGAGTGMSSG